MTIEIVVAREARADIANAIDTLNGISPRLTERFGVELERIYSELAEHPQMYPSVYKNFRRALLRKFPYSVFYVVYDRTILIVGVVHQSRDESTWKRRA